MSISIKNSRKLVRASFLLCNTNITVLVTNLIYKLLVCLYFSTDQSKFQMQNERRVRTLNIYNRKSLKTISYILQKLISPQVWLFKQLLNAYILLMASSISEIWSLSWFHCSGLREIPTRNFKETIKLCPVLKNTDH